GQIERARLCRWEHMELHLVVDTVHEHMLGTARLYLRALDTPLQEIWLDLGPLRLSGDVRDSAGRGLTVEDRGGSLRALVLPAPLSPGEEEVLEVRFDAVPGPGFEFLGPRVEGWVSLAAGRSFPRIHGQGQYPSMDITLFADGERTVVGPGQLLEDRGDGIGPPPAHFRLASSTDPDSVDLLIGPMETIELSSGDEGYCISAPRPLASPWTQAWMRARAVDADPGAPVRVAFLPAELNISGWRGGWAAVPLGEGAEVQTADTFCRALVLEQGVLRNMLPESDGARRILEVFVEQVRAKEGWVRGGAPDRIARTLSALEAELGADAYQELCEDFGVVWRSKSFDVWDWARFVEARVGYSAESLFSALTGR
ncbi:MAG: hypothetical protein KDB61_03000, partial [Planctomycetes bacterium]|nr:hypothetical protein [Planctomycetota bacterium]